MEGRPYGRPFFALPRLIPLDKLREHYADHFAWGEVYVNRLNARYDTRLFVNPSALYIAVKSAYDDIERYKLYHQDNPIDQKSNSVKRVSYLTKWIVKSRPIQYEPHYDLKNAVPFIANAGYALSLSRAHISAEIKKEFHFTLDKESEFIYDLTYREITGDGLLAIFQNFYDLLLSVQPFEKLAEKDFSNSAQRP
jgi:hypothetical protein